MPNSWTGEPGGGIVYGVAEFGKKIDLLVFLKVIENYSVILTTVCTNELFYFKEPSDNGPLFTELKFYQRAAKPEQSKKYSTHVFAFLKLALVLFFFVLSQD